MPKMSDYAKDSGDLPPMQFSAAYPFPFLVRCRVPPKELRQNFQIKDSSMAIGILADGIQSEVIPILAQNDESFNNEVNLGQAPNCDIVIKSPGVNDLHAVFKGDISIRKIYLASRGQDYKIWINLQKIAAGRWSDLNNFDLLIFGDRDIFLFCLPEGLRQLCRELATGSGTATKSGAHQAIGEVGEKLASANDYVTEIAEQILAGDFQNAAAMMETQLIDYGFDLINVFEKEDNSLKILLKIFQILQDYTKAAMVCERLEMGDQASMFHEKAQGLDFNDLPDTDQLQHTLIIKPKQTSYKLKALQTLKNAPVFAELSPDEMKVLSPIIKIEVYEKEGVVGIQGTVAKGLYILIKGDVAKVRKIEGKNKVFGKLGQGDFAGERSVIDQSPAPCHLFALSASELFLIDRQDFLKLAESNPGITSKLYHALLKKIYAANSDR